MLFSFFLPLLRSPSLGHPFLSNLVDIKFSSASFIKLLPSASLSSSPYLSLILSPGLMFFLPNTLHNSFSSLQFGSVTCCVTLVCSFKPFSLYPLTQQLVSELVPVCVSGGNRWRRRVQADLTVSLSFQLTSSFCETLPLALRLLSSLYELHGSAGKASWRQEILKFTALYTCF